MSNWRERPIFLRQKWGQTPIFLIEDIVHGKMVGKLGSDPDIPNGKTGVRPRYS
jgi:hypothetical protein